MNKIKKVTPIIIGTDIKVLIKLPEVSHESALPGLEKLVASDSPLTPTIKTKLLIRKIQQESQIILCFYFPFYFHLTLSLKIRLSIETIHSQ